LPTRPGEFHPESLTGLSSLGRASRDHRPDVSATLTTVAFDQSRLRWLGIGYLIAEDTARFLSDFPIGGGSEPHTRPWTRY